MEATATKNRIDDVFAAKDGNILNVYVTAGYPNLNDTVSIMENLQEAGADLIELGMPYSDPIADGPTIQASSLKAIENGMTINTLFEQLKHMRKTVSVPVILMGYINPAMQYGLENFCKKCQEVGIDGLILPDLPMHEYLEVHKPMFDAHGLYNIFLITPQTSEARIRVIDESSNGFIYMVSSASITGAKSKVSNEQEAYFARVKAMGLKNPTLIGFGISNHETFSRACAHSRGAIIGSAFINLLKESTDLKADITRFIKEVKGQG